MFVQCPMTTILIEEAVDGPWWRRYENFRTTRLDQTALTGWINAMFIGHDLMNIVTKNQKSVEIERKIDNKDDVRAVLFVLKISIDENCQTTHLPELGTNLVTTLSSLNVNDFPHCIVEFDERLNAME